MIRKYKHLPTDKIACFSTDDKGRPKSTGWEEEDKIDIPLFLVQGKDWEEVKDKPEWTILSFKVGLKVYGYHSKSQCFCDEKGLVFGCYTLKNALENNVPIQSVRRESDGEVFTIGEDYIDQYGKKRIIGKFSIIYDAVGIAGGDSLNIFTDTLNTIKKVPIKEWEITSFRGKVDKDMYYFLIKPNTETGVNMFAVNTNGKHFSEVELLRNISTNAVEIYSVKRLSDGVEFKIEDKFKMKGKHGGFHDEKNIYTLKRFDEKAAHFEFSIDISATIKDWVKVNKLFTTEDGVDIYEGDTVQLWYIKDWRCVEIYCQNYWVAEQLAFTKEEAQKIGSNFFTYLKWFLTKEAAEEYVLMNKPCLSLKEVLQINGQSACKEECFVKNLKSLVKSKLK